MKVCFVTVGATASFKKLVYSVLTDEFLVALKEHNFTHLMVQFGHGGETLFHEFLETHPEGSPSLQGLGFGGFAFKDSLDLYFAMAMKKPAFDPRKGPNEVSNEDPSERQDLGLVISHAGTGSVLAAMRSGIPLVIVPNPDLADNHQEDLANTLEHLGYAHKSAPEDVALAVGIASAKGASRPGTPSWQPQGMVNAMTDQMSWVD